MLHQRPTHRGSPEVFLLIHQNCFEGAQPPCLVKASFQTFLLSLRADNGRRCQEQSGQLHHLLLAVSKVTQQSSMSLCTKYIFLSALIRKFQVRWAYRCRPIFRQRPWLREELGVEHVGDTLKQAFTRCSTKQSNGVNLEGGTDSDNNLHVKFTTTTSADPFDILATNPKFPAPYYVGISSNPGTILAPGSSTWVIDCEEHLTSSLKQMFGSRVELKAVAQGRPFQNDDASFSDMTADSFSVQYRQIQQLGTNLQSGQLILRRDSWSVSDFVLASKLIAQSDIIQLNMLIPMEVNPVSQTLHLKFWQLMKLVNVETIIAYDIRENELFFVGDLDAWNKQHTDTPASAVVSFNVTANLKHRVSTDTWFAFRNSSSQTFLNGVSFYEFLFSLSLGLGCRSFM